jgi:hypothetical protein
MKFGMPGSGSYSAVGEAYGKADYSSKAESATTDSAEIIVVKILREFNIWPPSGTILNGSKNP